MTERTIAVKRPFDFLYCVSFYKNVPEETSDGYKLKKLDGYSLPWEWYLTCYSGEPPVRAFKLEEYPIRALGVACGKGRADMEVNVGEWLVFVDGVLKVVSPKTFLHLYEPLVGKRRP